MVKRFKDFIKKTEDGWHVALLGNNKKSQQTKEPDEDGWHKLFAGFFREKKDVKEGVVGALDGNTNHATWQHDSSDRLMTMHERLMKHYHHMPYGLGDAIKEYTEDSSEINEALYKDKIEPWHDHQDTVKQLDMAMSVHRTPHNMLVHTGIGFSPENMRQHNGKIFVKLPAYTSTSLARGVARSFAKPDTLSVHTYAHFNHGEEEKKLQVPHKALQDYLTATFADHRHKEVQRLARQYGHTGPTQRQQAWHYNKGYTSEPDHELGFSVAPYHHFMTIHVPQGTRGVYASSHSSYEDEHEFIMPRNSKVLIHPTPRIHAPSTPGGGSSGLLKPRGFVEWRGHLVHDGTEATEHGRKIMADIQDRKSGLSDLKMSVFNQSNDNQK